MSEQGFQGSFRQSMTWLHTWVGLVLSLVLYFMFITGSFGYFNAEIDHWMKPEQVRMASLPSTQTLAETGLHYLQREAPDAKEYWVTLPSGRHSNSLTVYAELRAPNAAGEGYVYQQLNPITGELASAVRETGGGDALYAMHYALHYMPYEVAIYIVGVATMFMFIALLTGIVIHKKIFVDFFTLRFNKGQRSWLDGHNMSSVLALPFLLMITYSGLIFYTFDYLPSIKVLTMGAGEEVEEAMEAHLYPGSDSIELTGEKASLVNLSAPLAAAESRWPHTPIHYVNVSNPGDNSEVLRFMPKSSGVSRGSEAMAFNGVTGALMSDPPTMPASAVFSDAMMALHEGHFANIWLRWLYFVSGLVGAAMIATGLVLWAKKRRQRLGKRGTAGFGLVLIERSNLGIVVGLPLGVVAYFWANRVLPVDMVGRGEWEMHCLFLVWLASFFHAGLRDLACAWREQVGLLAALSISLPLLNAVTTDVHLVATLREGDWVRAGFDLTAIAFGVALVAVWRVLPGSSSAAVSRRTRRTLRKEADNLAAAANEKVNV